MTAAPPIREARMVSNGYLVVYRVYGPHLDATGNIDVSVNPLASRDNRRAVVRLIVSRQKDPATAAAVILNVLPLGYPVEDGDNW